MTQSNPSSLMALTSTSCRLVQFGSRFAASPQVPPDEMWTLWFDVYEASELPVGGIFSFLNLSEAEVELSLGQHKVTSARDTIKVTLNRRSRIVSITYRCFRVDSRSGTRAWRKSKSVYHLTLSRYLIFLSTYIPSIPSFEAASASAFVASRSVGNVWSVGMV